MISSDSLGFIHIICLLQRLLYIYAQNVIKSPDDRIPTTGSW